MTTSADATPRHTIVDRFRLIPALRPAGPWLLALLTAAMVVDAMVPGMTAYALGELVGQVRRSGTGGVFEYGLAPLAFFASVLLLGHVTEALIYPLSFLATARIDGVHRVKIAKLALSADRIDALERPAVQRLIREVAADPSRGYEATPATGALALMRWAVGFLGVAVSCLVLARYAWWLAILVVVPAFVNRAIRNRQAFEMAGHWRQAVKDELPVDSLRRAATSAGEGKDIRIFGFADWMVRRMQEHIHTANASLWGFNTRVVRAEWSQLLLVCIGLVPAYLIVTMGAVDGSTTIAVQTAVLAAGWSVFLAMGANWDLFSIAGSINLQRATEQLRQEIAPPAEARPDSEATRAGGEAASDPAAPATACRPPQVVFDDIHFGYPGSARTVLDGISLDIKPGELLAIVGLNGAGKSTLIKLLMGLYRPTRGRVLVDGEDIDSIGLNRWRARAFVVFQDFVRYQLSAAENVALGRADVPHDERAVVEAAFEAGFHDVVDGLPDGWNTQLSRVRSSGVDLSGGQWQQLVLARALYAARCGAQLLVLDEPTAHLDVRTEAQVFDRIMKRRGSTSVVLISHRLSTVRHADRIVLLDGGKITESGTHDELMARDGMYAELFTIQAQRFQRGFDDRLEEGELL